MAERNKSIRYSKGVMVAVCLNGGMYGSNKVVSFVFVSFENNKAAILLIYV